MAYQPEIAGIRHTISAGHYLAAQAGFDILEAGGNAVDAGVAAGLALAVVQPDIVQFGGVAPIMIRMAETGQVITISGLGVWPRATTLARFTAGSGPKHGGSIPRGVLRTVVPAAPDAWIQALHGYGTMTFGQVAEAAIRFAREGFAVHHHLRRTVEANAADYAEWPTNAALFLPGGKPPDVGSLMVQPELADSIQHLADSETATPGDRAAGLAAARDTFYRGDIAAAMVDFQAEQGGLLDRQDLAEFRCEVEAPECRAFGDLDVYACGPWCQGPSLLQMLALLDGMDLTSLGHNSAPYLHIVTEAMKLAFADREAFYGDPSFVDVPLDVLLSDDYNTNRRELIREGEAWPELPPAGQADRATATAHSAPPKSARPGSGARPEPGSTASPFPGLEPDTSYVAVVDRDGNAFSATPSDATYAVPIVPGLGFAMSGRGSQSFTDPDHPSVIAPGKRPRLTPNPAMAVGPDLLMPFGTPGGDSQCQAMLQFLLNVRLFDMSLQEAVEAPRVITHCAPSSFEPHEAYPGRLDIEDRIDESVRNQLADWGHQVRTAPALNPGASAVCAVALDTTTGVRWGASDPRRPGRAIGW